MFLCCLMKHHTMKIDVVVTVLLQAFFNLALDVDGGEWLVSCPECFTPCKETPESTGQEDR